jgi:hypothetical protein
MLVEIVIVGATDGVPRWRPEMRNPTSDVIREGEAPAEPRGFHC